MNNKYYYIYGFSYIFLSLLFLSLLVSKMFFISNPQVINDNLIERYFLLPSTESVSSTLSIFEEADIFFGESLFDTDYQKLLWLNKLSSFYEGYKINFLMVRFFKHADNFDVVFKLKNGDSFYFHDGKILLESQIVSQSSYNTLINPYPKGELPFVYKNAYLFPAPIDYSFLSSVYGDSREEIWSNLIYFKAFGRGFWFSKMNNAAKSLQAAFRDIAKTAKHDKKVVAWIKGIRSISTYSPRSISNDDRRSLHSYGIAVDFLSYGNKAVYWNWSNKFVAEWWNIPLAKREMLPENVVDIMEDHGFIWGGKWYYFDNMHFEYRPEIRTYCSF